MKKSILLWLENELFSHLSKLLFVPNLKRHHSVRVGHHLSNRTQTQSDENPPRSKRIQTQWEISQPSKIAKELQLTKTGTMYWLESTKMWYPVAQSLSCVSVIGCIKVIVVYSKCWIFVIFVLQMIPRAFLCCFKKSPR